VLSPLTTVFEVKLTGTLDDPKWGLVLGPANLLRALAPGEPAPTAEKSAAPADAAKPPSDSPPAPATTPKP
jgi:hypothetical protein